MPVVIIFYLPFHHRTSQQTTFSLRVSKPIPHSRASRRVFYFYARSSHNRGRKNLFAPSSESVIDSEPNHTASTHTKTVHKITTHHSLNSHTIPITLSPRERDWSNLRITHIWCFTHIFKYICWCEMRTDYELHTESLGVRRGTPSLTCLSENDIAKKQVYKEFVQKWMYAHNERERERDQ